MSIDCLVKYLNFSDCQLDDADTQKISAKVRERLRHLNSKEFNYILIANKLPSEYRGTPHLSFLQNIPWLAVFDLFDPSSKKDGLHYVCNETTDAPRAINKTLGDFKGAASEWVAEREFYLSTRQTTWVSRSDTMHEKEWIKSSKDCLYHAISAFKAHSQPGRLICVFLALGENCTSEMADIIECCFSILGESASKCISILSESRAVADSLVKASKPALRHEIRDCTIAEIPWGLLKENVRDMIGPSKFKDRHAKTELPYFTGNFKEVLNKKIYSWNDLDVYSPNPKLSSLTEDIQKARDTFYKGGQMEQMNLFHNHDIRRTLEKEVCLKVEQALKAVAQHSTGVKTVTVPYEAGSGATTLCRRILWEKRKDYRCAVVKAFTRSTDFQIEELQRIVYDEQNMNYAPPVLILVDNFSESELTRLSENLRKRQSKCVILSTFPVSKSSEDVGFDITPLRQLDESERAFVKNILITITKDDERRKGAEKVLERERRFIWFGLELFGRGYLNIEGKLKNHIDSILKQNFTDGSEDIYETILNFCCLLHYYNDSRTIFPHPIVIDYLYEAEGGEEEVCHIMMEDIHERFGGLLLEDFNETHGYHAWRPSHSLVGEVVKSRMNLDRNAQLLLEKMQKGQSHTKKYLAQEIVKVFLHRKRISETIVVQEMHTDHGLDSSLEFELFGISGVRTRYSPLIIDIMDGEGGNKAALRLFIRLCETVTEVEAKAYSWQQLARFIGYEFGIAAIDKNEEAVFIRMHSVMKKMMKEDENLSMPKTGIDAAHKAIDVAIGYQPSYAHHYVTKGNLYLLELKDRFKDPTRWIDNTSLAESIDICRQALIVYDKAEANARHQLSHYSVIGKIQVIISILEIVRRLPCFYEGSRFTEYLNKENVPQEMKDMLPDADNKYIQNFRATAPELLNHIFQDIKLRKTTTWDVKEIRALDDTSVLVFRFRRKFYEVTGLDRNSFRGIKVDQTLAKSPAMYQQVVQDILFKKDETPYSSWVNMSSADISTMYNLLKDLCCSGYGSNNAMLICCKACLRLTHKPPIDELTNIVTKWVQRFQKSEWAHLYNYMLHFPSPNGSLATNRDVAKESCKTCVRLVRERTGRDSRKSGAEYFLGKGIGLHALVSATDLPSRNKTEETKTAFWRSTENFNKLERVCGQKDDKGVVDYQGIRIPFDDTRYPKQSKDDLWFYLGFTVTGPYAFDPLDQDDYDAMRRRMQAINPPQETVLPLTDNHDVKFAGFGRGKRRPQYVDKPHIPGEHGANASKSFNPNLLHGQSSHPRNTVSTSTPQLSMSEEHSQERPRFDKESSYRSLKDHKIGGSTATPLSGSVDTIAQTVYSSYASAVEVGASLQPPAKAASTLGVSGSKTCAWKTVSGCQDWRTREFNPLYEGRDGRLHHGAFVLGMVKSQECRKHKDEGVELSLTNACKYAHSWRGDAIIQHVCTKCTNEKREFCDKKLRHSKFIWNLGPYFGTDGRIWKK